MRKKIIDNKDIIELIVDEVANSFPSRQTLNEAAMFHYKLKRLLEIYLSDEALTDLIDGLNDTDTHVRWCAVTALGCLGPGMAVPALLSALKDKDLSIRNVAKNSLSKICHGEPSDEALEALKSAFNDSDYFIRESAIRSLGSLKSVKVMEMIPDLILALNDNNKEICDAAASSLRGMTGKSFLFGNTDPKKWDKWWNDNKVRLLKASGEQHKA